MDNELSLTSFQLGAAKLGLQKMMKGKYFSICDLETIAKIIDVPLAGKDYDTMRILHCMDWAVMGPEMERLTKDKIVELLSMRSYIPSTTLLEDPSGSKSFMAKLLGSKP